MFTIYSISDIVVQILGIGKCEWSEQRRTYQSEEIYLKNEIKIAESKQSMCVAFMELKIVKLFIWYFNVKLKINTK